MTYALFTDKKLFVLIVNTEFMRNVFRGNNLDIF